MIRWFGTITYITLFLLLPQSALAGGKGYFEGERVDELIFAIGYGPQGGSNGEQSNHSVMLAYTFLEWDLTSWLEFNLSTSYTYIKSDSDPADTVNAISIGPGLRFLFLGNNKIQPFFYLSIAPTYIDSTTLGSQSQGSHFLFSDPVGFGLYFGQKKDWLATIGWHHLSNGSLFPPNPGYDVPINIGIGRRF